MTATTDQTPRTTPPLPQVKGRRVIVCAGTGCKANGSAAVFDAFVKSITAAGAHAAVEFKPESGNGAIPVTKSGCQGICSQAPLVTILPDNILYMRVKPADVEEIVKTTLGEGKLVERLLCQARYRRNLPGRQ